MVTFSLRNLLLQQSVLTLKQLTVDYFIFRFLVLCFIRGNIIQSTWETLPPQMNPKASFDNHDSLPNTMDGSLVQELGQLLKLLRDFKLTAHAMVDAAFQIRTAHRSLPPLLLGSLWIVGNRITLMFYFPSSLDSLHNK